MCGIFGLLASSEFNFNSSKIKKISSDLLRYSESRGKEATGVALKYNNSTEVLKSPSSAKYFIKSQPYQKLFKNLENRSHNTKKQPLTLIGHSRLVTNGTQKKDQNNQPVIMEDFVCVHNGIIVNCEALWKKFSNFNRESDVDTEIFLKIVNDKFKAGKSISQATQAGFQLMEGSASIALLHKTSPNFILATNTGSLYYLESVSLGLLIFASEEIFLKNLLKKGHFSSQQNKTFALNHLKPGTGINLNLSTFEKEIFSFNLSSFAGVSDLSSKALIYSSSNIPPHTNAPDFSDNLKRCTKCILPETMPFISFDENGICSYCSNYRPYICNPLDQLEHTLNNFRKKDGSPDCIVAFSGGRDSSYGLHLLKKEFNLNPLAMTYDWGVVTDLARRNQARICGTLGIEHILISADIEKKRRNIKQNLEAWLKKPELGMIPLLMAGDKKFFYFANKIAKKNNIKLIIFCVNPLEKTEFKSGFAGVNQAGRVMYNQNSLWQNINMLSYYLKNFIQEPNYLNSSLGDTMSAYFVSYFMKHPYVQLFDYYRWDEEKINDVLIKDYNWETDPTTTTTWRIGDGTAAFYNYVYQHVVGFTENDTFRSNQIREGIITRDQAIKLVQVENKPRYEAIQGYLNLVNVDFDKTMTALNSLPRLY